MNGRGLLLAAVALLVVAGSAFAWGGGQRAARVECPDCGNMVEGQAWTCQSPRFGDRNQPVNRQVRWNDGRGMRFGRFDGELPEAMQEKVLEMRKVQHEIALALMEKDVDKAKVTALHEKRMALRNEISRWRFEQGLNRAAGEKNPMMRGGMWRQDRPENRRNGGWDERREWRENRQENRQQNRQDNRRPNWQQNRPNA